jgi:hypothetical protein
MVVEGNGSLVYPFQVEVFMISGIHFPGFHGPKIGLFAPTLAGYFSTGNG